MKMDIKINVIVGIYVRNKANVKKKIIFSEYFHFKRELKPTKKYQNFNSFYLTIP